MHPLLFRLIDTGRLVGPLNVVWIAPLWAFVREFHVFEKRLDESLLEARPPAWTTWTWATEADGRALQALNPTLTPTEVARRLRERQEGLLCWVDGALVYYRWDTTVPTFVPFLRRSLVPEAGDLITRDAYTHPSFRRRGLHAVASLIVQDRARARGCRRALTLNAWWNRPMLKRARQEPQRRRVGRVVAWGIGPWRRCFASGAVRLGPDSLHVLPTAAAQTQGAFKDPSSADY